MFKTKLSQHRWLGVTAIAVVSAVALTGCSALSSLVGNSAPSRDGETGEIVEENNNADVFSVRVGDCLNTDETATGETSSVPVVPCSEPHADEAYFAFDLPEGDFPGTEAVVEAGNETCAAEFEGFVGMAYAESALDFWTLYPSESSWDAGDREIICMVWDPAAQTVGTLQGAGR